jgi:hypothetical protein
LKSLKRTKSKVVGSAEDIILLTAGAIVIK